MLGSKLDSVKKRWRIDVSCSFSYPLWLPWTLKIYRICIILDEIYKKTVIRHSLRKKILCAQFILQFILKSLKIGRKKPLEKNYLVFFSFLMHTLFINKSCLLIQGFSLIWMHWRCYSERFWSIEKKAKK